MIGTILFLFLYILSIQIIYQYLKKEYKEYPPTDKIDKSIDLIILLIPIVNLSLISK